MSPSPVIQPPVLPLAHVIFWIQLYSSAYVIVFTDVEAAKESMISTKFRLYESNSKTCGHEGSKRVNQWRYIGVSQVR